MKNKKAAIEVQFNWLFVMIIGGIILFFFIMLVFQQKEASEKKLAVEVSSEFELIFAGSGVASGVKNEITIPDLPIEFSCEGYEIGDASRGLGNTVLFAPKTIEGDKMLSLTQAWYMPMLVTNFVYVTSPDVKYYFVASDNQLANQTKEAMPEKMDITIIDSVDDLDYERNYRVRFVFFYGQPKVPEEFTGLKDDIVTALAFNKEPKTMEDFNGGVKFRFYKKAGSNFVSEKEFDSYGPETFYAAIFSDDVENYECNMKTAFTKLSHVAQIYNGRVLQLYERFNCGTTKNICCDYYATYFKDLKKDADQYMIGRTDVFSTMETIIDLNKNTALASCPSVY